MYAEYFHLSEEPFSITPDPAFVYMSGHHREALGHLLYGTGRHGGFVQLTGEVGTGKTTIVRTLLAQDLADVDVAVILNPRQSAEEFVASICDELGVTYASDASLKGLVDALNIHLLDAHRQGRRTVVIIDEAQNLTAEVLEQVRMLTNLETHKEKLLRIMLIGQPELADLLARPDLRQVAQRITARFHLTPLSLAETRAYIRHRLTTAGGHRDLIPDQAIRRIHALSGGIPRLINILCDRSLLGAYARQELAVTVAGVNEAASEALGHDMRPTWTRLGWRIPAALAAVLGLAALMVLWRPIDLPLKPVSDSVVETAAIERPQPQVAPSVDQPSEMSAAAPAPAERPSDHPTSNDSAPAERPPDTAAAAEPAAQPKPTETKPNAPATGLLPLTDALEGLWSVRTAETDDPWCTRTRTLGLNCYRGSAEWATLRALNRPVIVTLEGTDGSHRYRLIESVNGDAASVVRTDGTRLTQSVAELTRDWSGEFLLLWRRTFSAPLIKPDDRGDDVRELHRKMRRIAGREPGVPTSDRFDSDLYETIKAFQRSRGLDVDGLVGTRTMIALNDADPAWQGPRLIGAAR